jgi:hypothetical protein
MDDDEPLFRRSRSRLMLSPYLAAEGREFLARHRTLQQIWDRTLSRVPSYRERRQLVDDAFDSTLRRMEDRDIGVIEIDPDVLAELNMDAANRIWTRARARLEQQPPDAEGRSRLLARCWNRWRSESSIITARHILRLIRPQICVGVPLATLFHRKCWAWSIFVVSRSPRLTSSSTSAYIEAMPGTLMAPL